MEIELGQVVQTVLEAVLALVLPVVVGFLVQWLRARRDEMFSKVDERTRFMLTEAVEMAVKAAEQSGLAGLIVNEAKEKKGYALGLAEKYLTSWGVSLDLDVLAGMVEAEVLRQFSGGPEVLHAFTNKR